MTTEDSSLTADQLLAEAAWLRRLALRLVDPGSAEDVVQDTWEAALKARPESDRPLRPWLGTVMRNLVSNRARTRHRWDARAQRIAAADDAPLPTPEDLLAQHQAQRLVAELVVELPEPYRSTVLLCYAQGLSPTEVARRQNIPAGTVRWRLKQGLDQLRTKLDGRYGNDRRAWTRALAPLVGVAPSVSMVRVAALGAGAALVIAAVLVWPGARSGPAREAGSDLVARRAETSRPLAATAAGEPRPALRGSAPEGPVGRTPAAAAVGAARRDGEEPRAEAIARAMQPGTAPSKGPPDAPVTVVMFGNFQCPFSGRVQSTLVELLAAYPKEVRLVWRNLPLEFHEHAALAAEAALAAGEQGKFWPMHDRLFQHQAALDPPALVTHARALGLDVGKFQAALDGQRFRKVVEEDVLLAKDAGITGTPAFLINGKAIMGAQPLPAFRSAVDEALGRKPTASADRPPAPSPAAVARAAEVGAAPTKGPANAPVTVVQFASFQCPGCPQARAIVDGILAAHPKEIRFVWKSLPEASHPHEALAAEAALAAGEQGKFWEMHDRLHANPTALDRASLEAHAVALGLDVARFQAALDERQFRGAVEADVRAAQAIGLLAGPAYIVGKLVVRGPHGLNAAVQRELALATGAPPPAGPVPPIPGMPMDPWKNVWPPPRVSLPDEVLGDRVPVPFLLADAPMRGPSRAPVDVLYLVDLSAMGAATGRAIVEGLRSGYGDSVRIVARPVSFDGSGTGVAIAQAAWFAHGADKFWELHDQLLRSGGRVDMVSVEAQAAGLGIAPDELRAALQAGHARERVLEDADRCRQAELRGSHVFLVDGRRAAGTLALVQLIDGALKRARRPLPSLGAPKLAATAFPDATLPQRFLLAPRDEAGGSVGRALAGVLEPDAKALDPAARNVEVECRGEACRVTWRPGAGGANAVRAYFRKVLSGTSVRAWPAQVYFSPFTSRAGRSPEEVVAQLRSRRAGIIYSLRTGRTSMAEVPVERLPKE